MDVRHLVTGGAGFIGSHLAQALIDRGDQVVVVDNLTGGWVGNVPLQARLSVMDLVSGDVDGLVGEVQPTHIWHLAAYAAEGLSHWVREFNYQNNVVASAKLVTAAVKHGVDHFYFTSSMAVYGSQKPPFSEGMRPAPEDPYGIAKYAVEQDLAVASRMHGLNYTIFRPHNVYGPGQNIGDPYRNVVGIFMRQAVLGQPLTVFGDGEQTRAFSYITDITTPMVRSLTVPGSGLVYNIGGEQVVTIGELARRVATIFNARVEHVAPRVEVKHAHCDHSLAREHLSFRPKVSFERGLMLMADWVRRAGIRWSQTPTLEHEVGLPEFWRDRGLVDGTLVHADSPDR